MVLLIDDDQDIREVETIALAMSGHSVLIAGDGIEGLQVLERTRPSVILLDLMLPRMDGLTFLKERARRGLPTDAPVLCVSAAGQALVSEALRLGARECLRKPADLDHLCERVAHYSSHLFQGRGDDLRAG